MLVVEEIDIDKLKEDPNNVRDHNLENIRMIKNSIKEYGQYKPLIVEKDTYIVKVGNGRLRAMKELGMKKCYCIVTDVKEGLSVIDNRLNELSDWLDKDVNKWLLNEKGVDWWGVDINLGKELIKSATPKKERKKRETKPLLCPCCGKPLIKKEKLIIS